MEPDRIAIVGLGKGGTAMLKTLLKTKDVSIEHVFDINPDAPGMKLAREHSIDCDSTLEDICTDTELDLILEATGDDTVPAKLEALTSRGVSLLSSEATRIVFHFLDSHDKVEAELQEYKLFLEHAVKERTRELEEANVALQKVNDEKTRYLMHATHQLKAPFAAIESYADVILDGYAGDNSEKTRDIVGKIKQRCITLGTAIKHMLELANLKSLVRDNISFEFNGLQAAVKSVIKHFKIQAGARNINVRYEPGAGISGATKVFCNRNQLLILISILVENAIHYSHPGSDVTISAEFDERVSGDSRRPADRHAVFPDDSYRRIILSVKDRGIGIEEDKIEKIFDEYFRTNRAAKVSEHGTGLGLAIAREIASLHYTGISVQSEEDRGSVFSFHLMSDQRDGRIG